MRFLVRVAVTAFGLWVAIRLVDGLRFTGDWLALVLIAVIFGLVNAVIRPVVKILSLPLLVLTFGLFALVVNALMLAMTIWISGEFDLGLRSAGFGSTFLAALVVTVVTWAAGMLVPSKD